ncbi:polysaccharide deacetylase family protein [Clostridium botulinum]|uniref:polysaccharide deacetylase family protein n=1 Tax=Clostridium sp. ZBS13 TaxID=2949971 RepID=UPI001DA3FA6F|nr:polysaccharide deacetylase family protein [Clostridium sp. ZBS13]MBN1037403.1 polysaccharide deacetylase family protein [Clostridium botulinum]MBN1044064.1 polysaccharide deacetylase family protein [Clostridium botulinum]
MKNSNNFFTKKNITILTCVLICVIISYFMYNNLFLKDTVNKNSNNSTTTETIDNNQEINDTDKEISDVEDEKEVNTNNDLKLTNENVGVPVLYYHSVKNSENNEVIIAPQKLRNQLRYIKDSGYTTLTLKELEDYLLNNTPIPEKSIVITFDDGYMDNYTNAFPILKDLDMKATIFCITFELDGKYYLSESAIKKMSDYGIDIQSHTAGHPDLTKMTYDEQLKEFLESKEILEAITEKPVTSIAYPYGNYNDNSVKAAKDAGFKLGFTTDLGLSDRDDNPLLLNRIYISSSYDMDTFKQLLENTKK